MPVARWRGHDLASVVAASATSSRSAGVREVVMAGRHDDRSVVHEISDRNLAARHGDLRAVAAVGNPPAGALVGGGRVMPTRRKLSVGVAKHLVDDLVRCLLLLLLARGRGGVRVGLGGAGF